MLTLDFETQAIDKKSHILPTPVGLSIKIGNQPSKYYSWGHPTDNNCDIEDVLEILHLQMIEEPLLFHNAKFDLGILKTNKAFSGLPDVDPLFINDTMLMAYIYDPRLTSLKLKDLANDLLNRPPEEQTELKRWIISRVREANEKNWGAYISKAPGIVVAPYAEADTDMTYDLYLFL